MLALLYRGKAIPMATCVHRKVDIARAGILRFFLVLAGFLLWWCLQRVPKTETTRSWHVVILTYLGIDQ